MESSGKARENAQDSALTKKLSGFNFNYQPLTDAMPAGTRTSRWRLVTMPVEELMRGLNCQLRPDSGRMERWLGAMNAERGFPPRVTSHCRIPAG